MRRNRTPSSYPLFRSSSETWSPVSNKNAAEAEEAADIIFPFADRRVGKTVPTAEILSLCRKICTRQSSEDDRCPSQDLVPEQTDKMAVGIAFA